MIDCFFRPSSRLPTGVDMDPRGGAYPRVGPGGYPGGGPGGGAFPPKRGHGLRGAGVGGPNPLYPVGRGMGGGGGGGAVLLGGPMGVMGGPMGGMGVGMGVPSGAPGVMMVPVPIDMLPLLQSVRVGRCLSVPIPSLTSLSEVHSIGFPKGSAQTM